MILTLTEAGGAVGYGHLTRCLAIAQNFSSDSCVIVHPDEDARDQRWRAFPWRDDIQGALARFGDEEIDLVLVDSYLADLSIYRELKDRNIFLAVIDDYDRLAYAGDIVINPAISGPDYLQQNADIVSGKDWVILRQEILEHQTKKSHTELRHVSLSFGGADKKGCFYRLVPLLLELGFHLSLIAGTDERAKDLSAHFPGDHIRIYGRLEADKLADVFVSSDLAISAGGQTLNELAYLGVPFLAIETGADQFWNISGYVGSGVTPCHFSADDSVLENKIVAQLELLRDPERRREMAERGADLIDGEGAQRIANLLEKRAIYSTSISEQLNV